MTTRTGTCVDCGGKFIAGKGAKKRCSPCSDEHEMARQRTRRRKRTGRRRAQRSAQSTQQPQETAR